MEDIFKGVTSNGKRSNYSEYVVSFVFYWNETYLSNTLWGGKIQTLPLKLQSFTLQYEALYGKEAAGSISESVSLAGTLLSILPLLVMYLIFQRQFVESIESTGITGE